MDTNIWFLGLFKWNNVMWRWRCRWCFQLNITEITLHDECQYSSVVVVFTLRHTQLLYSSLITMVAGGVCGGVVSALPADIWWPGLKANMRECPEQWQQWRRGGWARWVVTVSRSSSGCSEMWQWERVLSNNNNSHHLIVTKQTHSCGNINYFGW